MVLPRSPDRMANVVLRPTLRMSIRCLDAVCGGVSSGRHIRFRPAGLVFLIGRVGRRRLEKLKKMVCRQAGADVSGRRRDLARRLGTWQIG